MPIEAVVNFIASRKIKKEIQGILDSLFSKLCFVPETITSSPASLLCRTFWFDPIKDEYDNVIDTVRAIPYGNLLNFNVHFLDSVYLSSDIDRLNKTDKGENVIDLWIGWSPKAGNYVQLDQYAHCGPPCSEEQSVRNIIYYLSREASRFSLDVKEENLFSYSVFISHTKTDDTQFIQEVNTYFTQSANGRPAPFVDYHSMDYGQNGRELMNQALNHSVAGIVLLTDNYSDRDWCIAELLTFKELRVPYVILDCLSSLGELSPHIGNAPIIRYDGTTESLKRMDDSMNLEVLNYSLNRIRGKGILQLGTDPQVLDLPRSLEPLDYLLNKENLIYPDPTLRKDEEILFQKPARKIWSFMQYLHKRNVHDQLDPCRVMFCAGLNPDDRRERTFPNSIPFVIEKMSYAMFILGCPVQYGGNMERKNLSDIIARTATRFEKSNTRPLKGTIPKTPRLFTHFISQNLVGEQDFCDFVADYRNHVNFENLQLPMGIEMRKLMVSSANVILAIGGKNGLVSQVFDFPGTIQEVLLAFGQKKRVLFLGGFGGAVRDFFRVILEGSQEERDSMDGRLAGFEEENELKFSLTCKSILDQINTYLTFDEQRTLFDSCGILELIDCIYGILSRPQGKD